MATFSCRPSPHRRASFCTLPQPRSLAPRTALFNPGRKVQCDVRSPQVIGPQENGNQVSFFQRVLRTIVLVPALGAALVSCNRLHAPPPSLPEVQSYSVKESSTTDIASPYASASISSGTQKAHVSTVATVSALLMLFGFQASKRKAARNASALSALGQGVPEDGSSRQANNKSRFSLPLGRRRLQASSTLETRPEQLELDSVSDVMKFGQQPNPPANNRYDIVDSVLNGKWQEENQTLDNLPTWDPISALHRAAGKQDKPELCKYDLFGMLFSPGDQQWDVVGTNGTGIKSGANPGLDAVPGWDPVSGIRSAARSTETLSSNRYDLIENVLRGNWQSEISQIEDLPAWDPISGLMNFARESGRQMDSKFDVLSSVLQGDWQTENSSLKNLPSWDPTGKLIQVATDKENPVKNSKYDAAASLLSLGSDSEAGSSETLDSNAKSQDAQMKSKQAERELEKNNVLESITLFMKELESVQEVPTLNA